MTNQSDLKLMDLTEFLTEGFLQEANRQFFHPLGLALTVNVEEDGTVSDILGIQDYRDDPEGFLFGKWHASSTAKQIKVLTEFQKHVSERQRILGQVIQNVGQIP